MRKGIIAISLVALLIPVVATMASKFVVPTDKSGNVNLVSGEYDDLYTAGGSVSIGTAVKQDLFVAGGEVLVTGAVEQDLFAAGGNVTVLGEVKGDARLAGGNVTVNSKIGEDVLAAGGTINFSSNAAIVGDLHAAGGNIVLNAPVAGSVMLYGEEVLINSAITGAVNVKAKRLTFGPASRVPGVITFKGAEQAIIQEGAVVSDIKFTLHEFEKPAAKAKQFLVAGFFIALLAKMLAALLLMKFFGNTAQAVVKTAYAKPWQSLGIGLVGIIVIPTVTVLLLATVIGFYLALLLGLWFVMALAITGLMSAIFAGGLLFKWIQRTKELELSWWSVVAGVLVLSVLKLIPVIGWSVLVIVCLMTFGSVLQTLKEQIVSVHMKK